MNRTLALVWTAYCYVASLALAATAPLALWLVGSARRGAGFWIGLATLVLLAAVYFPPLWRWLERRPGKPALVRFGVSVIRVVAAPAVLGLVIGTSYLLHHQLRAPTTSVAPSSAPALTP